MSPSDPPQNPIQITPQLLKIVILVLLMLAFPLTVASWFLVKHFRETRSEAVAAEAPRVVDDSALRSSFESLAATAWSDLAAPLDAAATDRISVQIAADDPAARQMEISGSVSRLGGTAVVFPPDGEKAYRILATVPFGEAGKFVSELTGAAPALPAPSESVLVEIRITGPAKP